MHEEGFKKALTNVVNKYARAKGLLKEKDDNLLGEDIREGLTAIISRAAARPQFEGQTKAQARQRLDAVAGREGHQREARPTGSRRTPPRPTPDRQEGDRRRRGPGVAAKKARDATRRKSRARGRRHARQAQGLLSRKTATSASCSSSRATRPAAPPSRPATRATQAILPIRGKILNVERARLDKMLKNNEIQALITAIGAGVGEEFDVDQDPLPQGHHPGRRRRRRQPHPHAAAHVLLPPDEGRWSSRATSTSPSRRCTRPWSARRRCT